MEASPGGAVVIANMGMMAWVLRRNEGAWFLERRSDGAGEETASGCGVLNKIKGGVPMKKVLALALMAMLLLSSLCVSVA